MAEEAQSQGRWESFEAAHGFVRDGLASLRNLETLLKSPRIGPRALEKVVAELWPGIRPLGEALQMLIELIDARDPHAGATASLSGFTRDRMNQLEAAVDRASGSDMGAKSRLQLEAQVVRLGAELDALRDLVELLDAATTFLPTELDLNALTTEALGKLVPPQPKHPRRVNVAFVPAPDHAAVVADPRVVMPLLATCLGLVASSRAKSIQVSANVDDSQGTVLAARPLSNGQAANIPCVPPRIIEPTMNVARTSAALARAQLVVDEQNYVVHVRIPPGQVSQTVVKTDARMQD